MTDAQRIEPRWLDAVDAIAIHDRQLAEHGGGVGLRDRGLLESALGRPVNQWAYGEDDLAVLAAAYAFGVARNHAFIDGNKRTAWVLARTFLAINDRTLSVAPADAIATMQALAAGDVSEDVLRGWFQRRMRLALP